jgi:hypothetical protein
MRKSTNRRIEKSSFDELNPLPEDLPGLIEMLLEIRWSRGNLSGIDPALPRQEYDRQIWELKLWSESLANSEIQCREAIESRLADASDEDRRMVLESLQRRTGSDIPASQMEIADLKRKINSQAQENLLNELRAKFAVKKKRKTTPSERDKVIFRADREGLKGLRYARDLDGQELKTPEHWQKKGCPKSYAAAYKEPYWAKMIQSEKSRITKRMKP